MQEFKIEANEAGQRLDRFVGKVLDEAPNNFIFRMIRKKNIEVNKKRAKPETILEIGDMVQFFLADETISKFQSNPEIIRKSNLDLEIVYEDKNIILINKKRGILSHDNGEGEENIVDGLLNYLIESGEYKPDEELTFTPAICNRLDRNTSGLIIAGKNANSLRQINERIKKRDIKRFYKTIVRGQVKKDLKLKDYVKKDRAENKMRLVDEGESGKEIKTNIRVLNYKKGYSLLEVELISGRTHQIRVHLNSMSYPIIGDRKYGDRETNDYFKDKYGLNYQFLHGYKVEFTNMEDGLEYLNGKTFTSSAEDIYENIEKDIFKGEAVWKD